MLALTTTSNSNWCIYGRIRIIYALISSESSSSNINVINNFSGDNSDNIRSIDLDIDETIVPGFFSTIKEKKKENDFISILIARKRYLNMEIDNNEKKVQWLKSTFSFWFENKSTLHKIFKSSKNLWYKSNFFINKSPKISLIIKQYCYKSC